MVNESEWLRGILQLGFAAGVAGYLVAWITRRLNGKLDRLALSMERLAISQERATTIQEQILSTCRRCQHGDQ